jgi:hypothetical protein
MAASGLVFGAGGLAQNLISTEFGKTDDKANK